MSAMALIIRMARQEAFAAAIEVARAGYVNNEEEEYGRGRFEASEDIRQLMEDEAKEVAP
jgi:hypothetical protein